ncbi:uncharacterized protein cubi_02287 [Cryptosporidium ubiquitum]|uniref:DOT1 domain-containing protein n=1 Tax=Cryptosporidium ubiquitum TaxID=857276 RepID=A0A1J4MFQ2_9CRYT|nr:uncharacterized protein cubi_02287 [Cryptosporidium ubiquitum]OII73056.1 hypothetical protein cubi_02287 [Cryptosporidium ubiquitum]
MTGRIPRSKQKENRSSSNSNFQSFPTNCDGESISNNCCNRTKCTCTSFLWRGVNVDLGTSDEGMYGETREKGLRKIFLKMAKYGLDNSSVLLDIGSGRGVPNIVASFQNNLFSSIGIELDEKAFFLSLSNHLHILESKEKVVADPTIENSNVYSVHTNSKVNKKINIGFFKGDATILETFEPVTHIYSFDAAMPIWMIKKFVDLFNMSKTTYCYVSYRKDLIETLSIKAKRIHGIPTQMMGSGEGRMCWLYLKNDWKEIKNYAMLQIEDKYTKTKNIELFDLTKLTNIDEIIRFSICNSNIQMDLINSTLNYWFNNRKSRKECLKERKIMNERHKELKQLYIREKLIKNDALQLTLEDVGVKMESSPPSGNSNKNIGKNKLDFVSKGFDSNLKNKDEFSKNCGSEENFEIKDGLHIHPTIKVVDPSKLSQKKSKVKRKVASPEKLI